MCSFMCKEVEIIQSSVKHYIGSDLKRLRKQLGLSLNEMSHLFDVSRTTYYRYEKADELSFPVCCTIDMIRQRYLSK